MRNSLLRDLEWTYTFTPHDSHVDTSVNWECTRTTSLTKAELIASMAAAVYPGVVALHIEARENDEEVTEATCSANPILAAVEIAELIWERTMDTVVE